MKILFLLFALFPVLTYAAETSSAYDRVIAKNELTCGVVIWPPYKELDPNTKEWKGFSIDLYRQMFATLDIKVNFKEVVLGTQLQDLNSGRIDAMCDDGPWTLSAGKFVEFANPVYASIVYPYIRKGDTRFKSRADLNNENITFTGIDGDLSSDLVHRLFPKAKMMSMPAITDVSQLFLNVKTKKADVVICDPVAFETFEKSNSGVLQPLSKDKPLGIYKNTATVKKGDTKMLGLINEAIDNAQAFGITDELLDSVDPKHEKLMRVKNRYGF